MADQNHTCTNLELSWPPLICSSIMLLCCLIGLPGNLISATVFFRLTSRSPINVLLLSLSLIDFWLLLFSTPIMILPSLNVYLQITWIDRMYPYALIVCYPISMITQSCSMWTFVLISCERFVAVCRPLHLRKWCTTSRTKCAQIAVVILSIMTNLIRFWEYTFDEHTVDGYRRLLRDNYLYFTLYHLVLHLITHFIIPFSVIAILGANILNTMSKTGNHQTGHICYSRRQASQRKTTRMIVFVTLMFIGCNSLPFLINIWEVIDFRLFEGPYRYIAFPLIDISNALVFLNSSTTFFFYWAYCQKYRLVLKTGLAWILAMVCCGSKNRLPTLSAALESADSNLASSSALRLISIQTASRKSSVAMPSRIDRSAEFDL